MGIIIYIFEKGISAYIAETSPPEIEASPVPQDIISREEAIPWSQNAILFLVLVMVSGIFILKGGNGGISLIGVSACTIAWWILLVIPILFLILVTVSIAVYLIKTDYDKWTSKKLLTVKSLRAGAGLITSIVGVDNGLIMMAGTSTASFSRRYLL